jgi:hypothetical protein
MGKTLSTAPDEEGNGLFYNEIREGLLAIGMQVNHVELCARGHASKREIEFRLLCKDKE